VLRRGEHGRSLFLLHRLTGGVDFKRSLESHLQRLAGVDRRI
jgi:hypothetical protein